jgi:hypothetical protein
MHKIGRIDEALHDMSQPLTTLQCRLELAGVLDTPEGYREAVADALVECAKLVTAVCLMHKVLHAESGEL